MSLDDAKQLIYLIAQRDQRAQMLNKFPYETNIGKSYDQSVIDLHVFIMSLVK